MKIPQSIQDFNQIFFIGIAGTGMSALAQYMIGVGKIVSGSDRYFSEGKALDIREKLEHENIVCHLQDGSGIHDQLELIVVSTAIEDTVPEVQKAKALNIPIIHRSALLSLIAQSKRTIAVAGTSGKSTTSAMLFDILNVADLHPSIISGAGLVSIIEQGKIGNAFVGKGEWLIIEADESDGSITQYQPEVGLLLNVDKDHQEMDELIRLFKIFKSNTQKLFITNQSHAISASLSVDHTQDFSTDDHHAGYVASNFTQNGMHIKFDINQTSFTVNTIGKHNMENAVAAVSVAAQLGVDLSVCSKAIANYKGIYRRSQFLGSYNGIHLIDDYAHNPVKCAASIRSCQDIAPKVIAWFQPHGYGPTRFLKDDFIHEFSEALRPSDELWMSEIFYAGGTAVKNISSLDIVTEICKKNKQAFFVEDRNDLFDAMKSRFTVDCVILLMGARDPGLEKFAKDFKEKLSSI